VVGVVFGVVTVPAVSSSSSPQPAKPTRAAEAPRRAMVLLILM
jgi:hypothetical protein